MATNTWTAGASVVAQVNTVTPAGSPAIGNTFTLTCGTKSITFTATAATVANVTAGLVALLQATTIAEFLDVAAADLTTALTLTARTPGMPFVITSAAAAGGGGGSPTLVTTLSVVNSGPNDLAVAGNWSLAAVPVAADDVVFDGSAVASVFWNLNAFSGFTLTSLTRRASYTGQIGLLDWNGSYFEYRPKYLQAPATTVTIGDGPGGSSSRFKWDGGSVQSAVTVLSTGQAEGVELEAVRLKGTHAANTLTVYGSSSVGVALDTGSVSTFATSKVGLANGAAGPAVRFGPGCTLTTLAANSGTVVVNSAVTTWTQLGGVAVMYGTGACTTLTLDGGRLYWNSSGTIATPAVGAKGVLDFTGDLRAKTITNVLMLDAGATLKDTNSVVTYSAGYKPNRCRAQDVNVDVGYNRTFTPS